MSISLGTLSFGVEADTSKLDKNLDKSEKKISRFSMLGVQRFNSLNSFNINSGLKKMDSLNGKLQKTQRESQKTIIEIKDLENQMNKIKSRIAETSGLNLTFDKSQGTDNRMTTTQYQSQLDTLALEDKEYQKLLNKQIRLTEKSEEQSLAIGRTREQMAGLNTQISKASTQQGLNNTFKNIGTNIKSAVATLGTAIKNTLKWSVILMGTGSIIRAITSGISSYLEYNKQLKADLDYMKFAIGQALAPAIQWVINLFRNLLGIVGAIAKVFFGVNLFANSFSNYMKNANTSTKKTAKNIKKAKEGVADFDEIHNIQKNDNTVGDNTGGGSGSGFTAPSFNASDFVGDWIPKIKKVKEWFDKWKWAILGVAAALVALKIASIFGASLPILAGIVAIFIGLGFAIQGIVDIVNGDLIGGWSNFLIGLAAIGAGVLLIFGPIPALITIIIGLVIGIVVTIVKYGQQMKDGINNFFGWLDSLINVDMTKLFGPVLGGMLNGVINTIRTVIDGIRLVFNGLIDFIQGIFTGNWKQALDGLINILKGIGKIALNLLLAPFKTMLGFFKGIIETIKGLWSKLWNGLKLPKIKMPHITVDYEYNGFKAEAAKLVGLPGWPKFGVQWYKKGGVFGTDSIIGVGEYVGAKSNPEIVTPQNTIYETVKRANQDTQSQNSYMGNNEIINFTNELKVNGKTFAREIIQDLNNEAKRLGYKPILQKG